jgi:hypothetical protein
MRMIEHSLEISARVLLAGFMLAALLQGCVERGAVTVNCDQTAGSNEGPRGCTPQSPYTGSAAGFRSQDGPSPVVNATCTATGSYKCAHENQTGCNLLNPNKVCKSYYSYTTQNLSGQVGYCDCKCVLP